MLSHRSPSAEWPVLTYSDWQPTCSALHLWAQIVGKARLAQTPWINHSWHATFYLTARGLTTSTIPYGPRTFQIDFDFISDVLRIITSDGGSATIPLEAMSVADFYGRFNGALSRLGLAVTIHNRPNEMPEATPFPHDRERRPYDAEAVRRYWRGMLLVEHVLVHFRSGFLGKVSPVHLFWGGLDLAVTRFSGRRAPLHPGGAPNLPRAVNIEAYSHEVSSAGFWPGGSGADDATFYSYAYPEPAGFQTAPVRPAAARYDAGLRMFVMPYAAVCSARDPEAMLLDFLQSTYQAAARLANWNRADLECSLGEPGVCRVVSGP